MRRKKVLFIPNSMPSHIIPLIALANSLNKDRFESAFLLTKLYREHVEMYGYPFFLITRREKKEPGTETDAEFVESLAVELDEEVKAITAYDPDVLVYDLNFQTPFASVVTRKSKISIVRKGTIPFEDRTPDYKHSSLMPEYFDRISKLNFVGFKYWKPESYYDLFQGDINIVPSIPLVESLPSRLENKSSYVYAGPLLISDQEMMGPLTYSGDIFGMIDAFFTKNADTKIVYCTVGLSEPSQLITRAQRCIRYLLDHNLAVITNVIDLPLDDAGQQSRFFASGYLPMDQVCSKVDLIIHQCGNGVYNYQLKHKIPGITLGSACYDRDDVAMKIEKLGAVGFIPAGLDDEAYNEKFSEMVRQLLDPSSEEYMTQKAALLKLHEEMIHVQQNFDFEKIVNQLISTAPAHNQA